jgi:ribosomal protein S6
MSNLNRYEGLFILNTAGKDEGVQEILSHIEAEVKAAGGRVDSIQKMDRRQFARHSHKLTSGYYANVIFHGPPDAPSKLRTKFRLDERVFRILFLNREEPELKTERKEKPEKREVVKSRG